MQVYFCPSLLHGCHDQHVRQPRSHQRTAGSMTSSCRVRVAETTESLRTRSSLSYPSRATKTKHVVIYVFTSRLCSEQITVSERKWERHKLECQIYFHPILQSFHRWRRRYSPLRELATAELLWFAFIARKYKFEKPWTREEQVSSSKVEGIAPLVAELNEPLTAS